MKKVSAILKPLARSVFAAFWLLTAVAAVYPQGQQHYNSPLYAPRAYDPAQTVSNGLPPALKETGIEQKLDAQLPLDLEFKKENGQAVKLGQFFNNKRPVVLALVYYECPMLCSEVLNGLTGSLKGISFNVGKEFDVVAISFDARENEKPELARNKKENYVGRYGRAGSENGWHFLTGSQSSIDAITKAVGFNYQWDEKSEQFAHAGGIMVITAEGRISKYFYGIDYAPRDVKFSLMEASQGKVGDAVDQLMLYCYHYDPSTGKYGLVVMNIVRLAAVITLVGIGALIFMMWRFNRNTNLRTKQTETKAAA